MISVALYFFQNDTALSRAAGQALKASKDPRTVEALIAALQNDEDETVRLISANALFNLKDPRYLEPLVDSLRKDR